MLESTFSRRLGSQSDACAVVFQLCRFQPYYAARVNVSRNTFFSSRSSLALNKTILFDVDIVAENKSKCGLSESVLLSTTNTRHNSFPKHFFVLFLHAERRVCESMDNRRDWIGNFLTRPSQPGGNL